MVLCSFFQRGVCYFGDKCKNEHMSPNSHGRHDRQKALIATVAREARTALEGNQWILSCYAPFRDKLGITIHNFIEDVSPEEMRWQYDLAKANGTFEQYLKGILKKIVNARKNMKMLTIDSPEITSYLLELYYNGNGNAKPFCFNTGSHVNAFRTSAQPQTSFKFVLPTASNDISSSCSNSNPFINVDTAKVQANDNPFISRPQRMNDPCYLPRPRVCKNEYLKEYNSNSNVYSKLSDLTEEEIEAFKSDKFCLGKVPTKPPCKEFCFD